MRVPSIEKGRGLKSKALFTMIRIVTGHRAPDVIRTLLFRPEMFGNPLNDLFQEVMRGPSEWSIGERELFAAWVSKTSECEF